MSVEGSFDDINKKYKSITINTSDNKYKMQSIRYLILKFKNYLNYMQYF